MNIYDLINELGNSKSKIANSLAIKCIVGFINDDESCPVANYLKSKGFSNVSVVDHEIYATDLNNKNIIVDIYHQPLFEFIKAFDCEEYVNLIDISNNENLSL